MKPYLIGVERDVQRTDVILLDVVGSLFPPRAAFLVAQPDSFQVRRHQELGQWLDAGNLGIT